MNLSRTLTIDPVSMPRRQYPPIHLDLNQTTFFYKLKICLQNKLCFALISFQIRFETIKKSCFYSQSPIFKLLVSLQPDLWDLWYLKLRILLDQKIEILRIVSIKKSLVIIAFARKVIALFGKYQITVVWLNIKPICTQLKSVFD